MHTIGTEWGGSNSSSKKRILSLNKLGAWMATEASKNNSSSNECMNALATMRFRMHCMQ